MRHRVLVVVAVLTGLLVPAPSSTGQVAAPDVVFTYSVDTRGDVEADVGEFISQTGETLDDPLGWTLGGSVRFDLVANGGDFTLWLASPEQMESFSSVCSAEFSCRVGDAVVINDENWREATPEWPRGLRIYRHMVVNHEVGHWLGLDHVECPGSGRLAPLMMQQSKGLNGCIANPWPTDEERDNAASRLGVAVRIPETLAFAPAVGDGGYRLLESDGAVLTFSTTDYGDFGTLAPLADLATSPDGGHWILDVHGGVFTFGPARFEGSVPGIRAAGAAAPASGYVAMAPTPSGEGYWIMDEHGGVFTFGDASFHGSIPGLRADDPNLPSDGYVALEPTPSGGGYWIIDRHGGVFTFGDASFHGSVPGLEGVPAVMAVAIGASPTDDGYWIVDEHGGVFTFGDASFHGSVPGRRAAGERATTLPVVDAAPTASGDGYWVMDVAGEVIAFGDAPFVGSGA